MAWWPPRVFTLARTPLRDTTILVVESDVQLLHGFADYLEVWGARVVRATTFSLGLRALVAERFDLLVSGVELPDGSGHELLADRRERVGAAVALAARRDGDAVDASRAAGFHVHLTKPCDPDMLARVAAALTA